LKGLGFRGCLDERLLRLAYLPFMCKMAGKPTPTVQQFKIRKRPHFFKGNQPTIFVKIKLENFNLIETFCRFTKIQYFIYALTCPDS